MTYIVFRAKLFLVWDSFSRAEVHYSINIFLQEIHSRNKQLLLSSWEILWSRTNTWTSWMGQQPSNRDWWPSHTSSSFSKARVWTPFRSGRTWFIPNSRWGNRVPFLSNERASQSFFNRDDDTLSPRPGVSHPIPNYTLLVIFYGAQETLSKLPWEVQLNSFESRKCSNCVTHKDSGVKWKDQILFHFLEGTLTPRAL